MDDGNWDFDLDVLDFSFINDNSPSDLSWLNQSAAGEVQVNTSWARSQEIECTGTTKEAVSQEVEITGTAKESTRKRLRTDTCCESGTKAVREKLRRERFNDKFLELSSVIDPGRPPRTDKVAVIGDAIRLLTQLRSQAEELEEARNKLTEEIKNLKAEKNELRDEKSALKADKERIEQQLKMATSASFMASHPTGYHPVATKMPVFPGYGLVPMWQYLPPSTIDTSHDHELRPPAA